MTKLDMLANAKTAFTAATTATTPLAACKKLGAGLLALTNYATECEKEAQAAGTSPKD